MGKIASTLLTFLFSIPITAVGFMAVFGVPQIAPLNASPSNEIVIRDPYDQNPWNLSAEQHRQAETQQRSSQLFNRQYSKSQQPQGQHSSAPTWEAPPSGTPQQQIQNPEGQIPLDQNPFGHRMAGQPAQNLSVSNSRDFPVHLGNSSSSPSGSVGAVNSPVALTSESLGRPANPFANGGGVSRPNTTETSAQMLTWLQASARLAELGIQYHLERGDTEGSFLFVCLYQPEETPQVTHRFEAEGNDPLVAVNLVVGQIERWLQQSYRNAHASAPGHY